jgi:O-antigen biosynthesis protein
MVRDEPKSSTMKKMHLLILCHEYPRPDVAASNRRLIDVLQLISKRHHVDIFCPHWSRDMAEPRYDSLYKSMGIRVIFGDGAALKRQLLRQLYDICLFEWWVTVPTAIDEVRRLQPWVTLIVDAVDVCFRREEAALALGRLDPAEVAENRRREIEAYGAADALLAVTSEDTAALRKCGLDLPIFFIPMIEPIRPRLKRARDREILFVGTFGINAANVDAVLWFVEEVWPSVRASVPDARLTLVGSHLTPEIEKLSLIPGIAVAGFVPDLEPYLDRAAVSIAPLRFGGGMKGKVTEALSHGLPLVTTRFGVQGLETTSGVHLIVADDPQAFAQGVVKLLQDEKQADHIGLAGQEFIARICAAEVVDGQVQAFLAWSASRDQAHPRLSLLKWSAKSALDRASSPLRSSFVRQAKRNIKSLGKRLTPPILWDAFKGIKSLLGADRT